MNSLIPPFEFHRVFIEPWADSFSFTIWIVLMGIFVGSACGLVGNYLLLRRMALVGDAISHSVLPGLVIAFLLFKSTHTLVMFLGALAAGVVTVALIEFIQKRSRVKVDAAICIVFTSLFALGVVITQMLSTNGAVHIDVECILYGEIAFVPLEPPLQLFGHDLGPASVMRMVGITVVSALAILAFYKELLITSFDAGLSKSMGIRTQVWHYGLMILLSLIVVSAFEAVGAIMVVAMLIVPPMFAAQLSHRLPQRLLLTLLHAVVSAVVGYHLSVWLNCSVAGAMVVAGS
ncbi:MAG: metal ABC transporter permease, partial [Luteolibacter sp.]